jgi:hypothetical protein
VVGEDYEIAILAFLPEIQNAFKDPAVGWVME